MSVVQKDYKNRSDPTPARQSIWLVVGADALQGNDLEALTDELKGIVREWFKRNIDPRSSPPPAVHVDGGIAETKKLRIFVQEV